MKFYTSFSKSLKLNAKRFLDVIPMFVEVTGEKLVEGGGLPSPPPPILNRVNILAVIAEVVQ